MIWFLITWIVLGLIVAFFFIKENLEDGIITVKDVFMYILTILLGYISLFVLLIISFEDWFNFVIYERKDK